MFRKRFLTSAILIALITVGLFNEIAFILIILSLTIAGLYEFFQLIKIKGIPIYSYTGIFIGALIPLSTYFQFQPTKSWELLFIVLALLLVFMLQLIRSDNSNAIVGISTTMFGVLYVSWLFSFLIKIRFLLDGFAGIKILAFLLIITKVSDIGALIIGRKYGKHPLIKRVSPNKTIEGSIGGIIASAIMAVLCRDLLPQQLLNYSIIHYAMMGAFFGGLGQLGDISESLLKRDCNVKDSGKILPAMGGALDAMDSILFSAPAFYFYLSSALTM